MKKHLNLIVVAVLAIVGFGLLQASYFNAEQETIEKEENENTLLPIELAGLGEFHAGDCFSLGDSSYSSYGLCLIGWGEYPDHAELLFAPILLDTTQSDMNQFKFGHICTHAVPGLFGAESTSGFRVIHYWYEVECKVMEDLIHEGNLNLPTSMLNATGGMVATSLVELKANLRIWDKVDRGCAPRCLIELVLKE